jgi:hypothetical protein
MFEESAKDKEENVSFCDEALVVFCHLKVEPPEVYSPNLANVLNEVNCLVTVVDIVCTNI